MERLGEGRTARVVGRRHWVLLPCHAACGVHLHGLSLTNPPTVSPLEAPTRPSPPPPAPTKKHRGSSRPWPHLSLGLEPGATTAAWQPWAGASLGKVRPPPACMQAPHAQTQTRTHARTHAPARKGEVGGGGWLLRAAEPRAPLPGDSGRRCPQPPMQLNNCGCLTPCTRPQPPTPQPLPREDGRGPTGDGHCPTDATHLHHVGENGAGGHAGGHVQAQPVEGADALPLPPHAPVGGGACTHAHKPRSSSGRQRPASRGGSAVWWGGGIVGGWLAQPASHAANDVGQQSREEQRLAA